jgi:hypothetical protein
MVSTVREMMKSRLQCVTVPTPAALPRTAVGKISLLISQIPRPRLAANAAM